MSGQHPQTGPNAAASALVAGSGEPLKKILPVDWSPPAALEGQDNHQEQVKRIVPVRVESGMAQQYEQVVNADRRVEIRVEVAWPETSQYVSSSAPAAAAPERKAPGRKRQKARSRKPAVARSAKRRKRPTATSRKKKRPQFSSAPKDGHNGAQTHAHAVPNVARDYQEPQPAMEIREPHEATVPDVTSPSEMITPAESAPLSAAMRGSHSTESPVDQVGTQEQPQRELEPADTSPQPPHNGLLEEAADEAEISSSSATQDSLEAAAPPAEKACDPAEPAAGSEVAPEPATVETLPDPDPEVTQGPSSERAPAVVENAAESAASERATGPGAGVVWTFAKRSDGQEAGERKKVLVIDDDPVIRMLLTMGLGSRGYECVTAENGKVAQELLQTFRPDVMIVDLLMPVMDGLSFLQWLRGEAGDTTPAVVLTNVSDARIQEDARACGADAILCKPLQLSNLLEEMNRLVTA